MPHLMGNHWGLRVMGNHWGLRARRLRGVSGLNRPFARTLLASAAIVAAIALAGCDADTISPMGREKAQLSEKMVAEMAAKNMDKESPILARIFKEESEMEVWKQNREGQVVLVKTYPICRWTVDLVMDNKLGHRP